jgi:hypothetical protein
MSTLPRHPARLVRRRIGTGFALLAGVVLCRAASAASTDDEPISSEAVAAAVRDLGADTLAARAAAEQSLLEMGPDVLELLPPVDVIEAPAVREAVRRIRTQLELQAARQSIEPDDVTLTGRMTLREAAAAIGRQTGNLVLVDRLPDEVSDRPIEVAFESAPFWKCLGDVQRMAGASWEMVNDPPAVALILRAADASPPVAGTTSGVFRVSVESLALKPGVVRVQFQLVAEPRLRPLFLKLADADFEAKVGDQPLELFSPAAKTELPMTTRAPASFAVLFHRPAEERSGPLTIKGKLIVETAAAPTEVHFRDLSGTVPVVRRRGGVTVTLQRARYLPSTAAGRRARVRLSISYDTGGPAFESHRTWIYHNDVCLQSEDGRRFAVNDGFDTMAEASGGVVVEYRFKDLPDLPPTAWELVYVAPTLLIEAPVEFEFRDLELPPASDSSR